MIRVLAFVCILLAASAHAGNVTLPAFSIERKISGIDVKIPVTVSVFRERPAGPVQLSAVFGLSDLFAKTDAMVRATGIERDEPCGAKFTYKGTQFSIQGGEVVAEARFNGGRQLCAKILGVRSKTTQKSNGSVTVPFRLGVKANRIVLQHGAPTLAVSNEIVRAILQGTRLDDVIQETLSAALDAGLSDPRASFQLPAAVQALGVTIETGQFEQRGSDPVAVVRGTLPAAAALLLNL